MPPYAAIPNKVVLPPPQVIAFNEKRGVTVLITVGSVGVAMLVMLRSSVVTEDRHGGA